MSSENNTQVNKNNNNNTFRLTPHTVPPFSVDSTLNMDIFKANGEKFRFTSTLQGWLRQEYLITRASYESAVMMLPLKSRIIARYLYRGQIYGFETQLLYKQSEPIPLWYLAYPTEIEAINLRANNRYPLVCEVMDQHGNTSFTRDISKAGASLIYQKDISGSDFKIKDQLELTFRLPDGTEIRYLKAELVRKYIDINQQFLGVQFVDTEQEKLKKIADYIDRLIAYYN